MAIQKDVAGTEDLALGTATRTQLRNGKEVQITEISARNIPYSNRTDSIKEVLDNTKATIDAHKNNKNNPHNVNIQQIGAEPADPRIQQHLSDMGNPHQVTYNQVGAAPTVHEHDDRYFRENEHVQQSTGSPDANKPVILDSRGKLDPSISGSGAYPVSGWTPTSGNEYPDPTGHTPGAWWLVEGVDNTNGYTFTGGDLAGLTAHNGNAMIWGESAWILLPLELAPTDYYKIDGSVAIIAPFAGGGQLISNIADGVADTDAATKGQLDTHIGNTSNPHSVTAAQVGADPVGSAQAVQDNLDTHEADTSNPHSVTAAQVGADPVGSADAVQTNLDAHTGNTNNPHSVTKAQVGLDFVTDSGSGDQILFDDGTYKPVPVSLPDATGKEFNELATDGSAADAAEWSPFRMTPKNIGANHTIPTGANATIGSFTLADTFTITVEDGASLICV